MDKLNKRKADLERTRQVILTVASDLFMTKGFKNTSTREIADKAKITQPNLYHHFKNKKELYLAVIEELTDHVQAELAPIVTDNSSLETKLFRLVKVLLEEHPANLFLMLNDMFQEMDADYERALYQIFKKTYIENIAVIFETEDKTYHLQQAVSVSDATRFVLYNVSALLSVEKTYQRKTTDEDIQKFIRFMLHGIIEK
ncbi:TetR/AcrR family transcriptional regulator [Enterococcus faecalis]